MSIEFRMDVILNYIFTWFTTTLPITVVPYLMSFYIYMSELFALTIKQLQITGSAIQDSFREKYIGFFRMGEQYIPVTMSNKNTYTTEPEWIYNIGTQVFSLCEIGHHTRFFHIPMIGASLSKKENNSYEPIGDLSNWIIDQKIYAEDGAIPLQIIASVWLYINNKTLIFNYKNMYMTIITELGEEITYNLENSNEMNNEDTENSYNSENMNKSNNLDDSNEDISVSSTPSATSKLEDSSDEIKID